MKLRHLILEKVAELGEGMLDAFFPASYPEARFWRELVGAKPSYKFSKLTFSTILSQLRKEGFVERKHSKKKAVWRITKKGLVFLCEHRRITRPAKDGVARIVSFDIPETQRKKRRWLREMLLEFGYRPLQKSVWLGFSSIPEEFFKEADLLSLRRHIHIFGLDKKGTVNV